MPSRRKIVRLVRGGTRRDDGLAAISSTNIFAALESRRRKPSKKKSDKDKSSEYQVKESKDHKETQPAPQVWTPAPVLVKSWVDCEDDDDYFATAAPPPPVSGSDQPSEAFDQAREGLSQGEESEVEEEGEDGADDEIEDELENETPLLTDDGPLRQPPPTQTVTTHELDRQLSKKELKNKELAELEAVLTELGLNQKDENDLPNVNELDEDDAATDGAAYEENTWEDDDSIHCFVGHSDSVFAVACSPTDLNLVATGGGDEKAYLWRIMDNTSPLELKGHTDSIGSLAFSFDGSFLATGGLDGIVNVWETSTGALKHKLEGPSEAIEWVRWHPRGHIVLAGSEDFTAWMWNANNATCLMVLSGHNGSVTCGGFTPDGKTICTGSVDGSLRVWNPKSGESRHVVQGHPYHTEGLTCLDISSDSSMAVSGSTDSTIRVVNIRTGKVIGCLNGHSKSIECVGLAPSLALVATGAMDGKLIIWDLQSLSPRSTCEHEEGVVKLIWSASSRFIFSGCLDGSIRVWDSRTGVCERTFHGHEDAILDLALTQDEAFILSSSDDATSRVYEMVQL